MIDWILILVSATPVILAALGEIVGQKSGVINVGIEGMMLAGAFVGVFVSGSTGSAWLGLAAGTAAGLALAMLSAFFTVGLRGDQVVVGTAINLFAMGLTASLFRSQFGQTGKLLTVPHLPKWHGVDWVMGISILLVFLIWLTLKRTGWGLAMRAAGEFPQATEASGFSVSKIRFQALGVGGALAGMGGAYLALGVVGSFAENMTGGRGFIALAMVTFGRWQPALVFLACLLIGYLDSLQYVLQARGSAVPFQIMIALPYVAALTVLVVMGKGTKAPAALGQPYPRES